MPVFTKVFKLVQLNMTQWLCCLVISILPIIIMECQKKINEIKFGKTIYEYKEKRISNI